MRAMLVRLENKGYIKHEVEGPRYIYSATMLYAVAKRAALKQYIRTFFGGSMRDMMTALVRQEKWTEEKPRRASSRDPTGSQGKERLMANGAAYVMFAASDSFAVSVLAKATLILLLALAVTHLARHARASVRHAVLASALGALLNPSDCPTAAAARLRPDSSLSAQPVRCAFRAESP